MAVSGKPWKAVELLRKRLRQLLRVIVVLSACVAVCATAFAIWWLNSLNGLPDIGDPFDVAAFRAFRIPVDQNAEREAHRELVIMLATELYDRERGSLPSSEEALVGTYLKSFSDESVPDVNDGTAPIVEERNREKS
jgi:hypothetical protein